MNLRPFAIFMFLLWAPLSYSQTFDLKGRIFEKATGKPLDNIYVVNTSTLRSTISDELGSFFIEGNQGDTIVFSNISFKFFYYYVPERPSLPLIIQLEERNYLLEEVNVSGYRLTTNDPEPIELDRPLVPPSEEINEPMIIQPSLSSPVDLVYYYFGSRPKQFRELQELRRRDAFKSKLREGFNREAIMSITGMSKEELNQFLFFCRYGKDEIRTFNDYVFLNSLLNCYEEYLKQREMDQLLRDQEEGYWEDN
ncbi:MAG: hypothetical protein LPK46_10865 [Bacteroidota bacterium]|nr:hypothetical protein [Bacteroidota bacterium]MDX5506624.1 hypothetical protein [Bacteroidota bacterium]